MELCARKLWDINGMSLIIQINENFTVAYIYLLSKILYLPSGGSFCKIYLKLMLLFTAFNFFLLLINATFIAVRR